MSDVFDPLEGLEFLTDSAILIRVAGFQAAINDFDRLEEAARRFGFPDLPEAALAQTLQESITRDGSLVFDVNHATQV